MPRYDPSATFRFSVEIDGVLVARFSECSGLEFSADPEEYREGGLNSRTHRLPTRFKFNDITLKRGIANDGRPLWTWVQNTVKGQIVTHDVTVTLYDVEGSVLQAWTLRGAFPIKWSATPLQADQNAVAVETLTLAHQGMDFAQ